MSVKAPTPFPMRLILNPLTHSLATSTQRRLLLFGEQHDDGIAQEVERAVYDVVTKQKEKKVRRIEVWVLSTRE